MKFRRKKGLLPRKLEVRRITSGVSEFIFRYDGNVN